jgi:stress response protein YsnF
MDSTLVGIFDTQSAAERARAQLTAAGFPASEVSLTSAEGAAGDTASTTRRSTDSERDRPGPITRFFDNLFGDDDDLGYGDTYREAFRRGACGVSVHAESEEQIERAQEILNDAGAVDIDRRAETWRDEGWSGSAAAASDARVAGSALEEGDSRTLKEVQEDLKVGKRAVARGGVRVFSRVVETPVEESVRLREEHANVQRRAVDRPATDADFQEGSIEVREMGEEAVVSKTARVVGEVEVSKSATEREETVHDSLRRTEVDVEPIEGDTARTAQVRATETARSDRGVSTSGTPLVTGLFPDRESAEQAYGWLTERGYRNDDIDIVMSDQTRKQHFAAAGTETELGSKAAEGAGVGGAIGGTLGAIAGAIAAVGTSIAIPGLGVVIAGPLAAGLAGAGAGAATGGLVGALAGWSIPEERVKQYDEGIRNGGILMGVRPRNADDARYLEETWRAGNPGDVYR